MAVLSNAVRAAITAELMQEISAAGETCAQTKSVVRTLVNETDAWQNDNASAFNNSLSAAPKSLSTPIKSRAFRLIARARYEEGA